MHASASHPLSVDPDRARRLAALAELGLRPRSEPETTELVPLPDGRVRLTQAAPAMGTLVAVTVVDGSPAAAEALIAAALGAMDARIEIFNRFDPASAVAVLNERGRLAAPPPELARVLAHASALYRASAGAFDVTVQPLVDLFRERRAAGLTGPPATARLAEALARVRGDAVAVSARRIELRGDGVGITLDGIAKGFIVDAMAEALQARGCGHYLVNAGGDIRARGGRDGAAPWRVAVRDPAAAAAATVEALSLRGPARAAPAADAAAPPWLDVICCDRGALATGSYEIFCGRDRTYHHLMSAATGASASGCRSVTVRAATCMQADALATALFVMGPAVGLPWLERRGDAAALVVAADGTCQATRNWNRYRPQPVPQRGRGS